MRFKGFTLALAAGLAFAAAAPAALADTIRLKNGNVVRGQIVSFRDEQFTVLMDSTSRGRRSRVIVYVEDVESIEFEGEGAGTTTTDAGTPPANDSRAANTTTTPTTSAPANTTRSTPAEPRPTLGGNSSPQTAPANTSRTTNNSQPASGESTGSQFFPVRVRVRADSTANGWTDTGLMVRRGQRLRISASGRVSLGLGRFSTPTGLPRATDNEKLMREEPTGALIAVIGDDNDEFIFVGSNREFLAPRDGRLFLGVNEGRLEDNTGTYDALIEAEPVSSGSIRP
ncbi:MAG TPA: hypothetical protein VER32_05505 [Pyrinomonadaceae bacterium]|nr:hypothetical protein [Pyrinomonadaceae bacterium]